MPALTVGDLCDFIEMYRIEIVIASCSRLGDSEGEVATFRDEFGEMREMREMRVY